jgi:hypothetical protein
MTIQLPPRERSHADVWREWESQPDVLFEEARNRRRRRWMAGTALITPAIIAAALILGMAGGGGSGVGGTAHRQPSGSGSGASSRARADIGTHRIGVAALTVSLPVGWRWAVARGSYRNCTSPIGDLALASYQLSVGFGKHEGPIVVPPSGILLELVSAPARSGARPWSGWRLSNKELRRTRSVSPNHYAAEVDLPRSRAAAASAYFGSIPVPRSVLAAANRVLRSVRINQAYGCQ